jgi:anti-sigma factor RsiW
MTHEDMIAGRLFEFHDGRLDESESRKVLLHLGECAECRTTLETWRHASRELLSPLQVDSSDFFVSQVMRRVEALEESVPVRQSWMPRLWIPALAFAAVNFTWALMVTTRPSQVSTESLLVSSVDSNMSGLLEGQATEDQLLPTAVKP